MGLSDLSREYNSVTPETLAPFLYHLTRMTMLIAPWPPINNKFISSCNWVNDSDHPLSMTIVGRGWPATLIKTSGSLREPRYGPFRNGRAIYIRLEFLSTGRVVSRALLVPLLRRKRSYSCNVIMSLSRQ